jgi:hypothetical protein
MTSSPESVGAGATGTPGAVGPGCAGLDRLSDWDTLVGSWRLAARGKQGSGAVARFAFAAGFGEFDASVQGWINHVRYADTWGLRTHVLARLPLSGATQTGDLP